MVKGGKISFGICSEGINVWLMNNRGIISIKAEQYLLIINCKFVSCIRTLHSLASFGCVAKVTLCDLIHFDPPGPHLTKNRLIPPKGASKGLYCHGMVPRPLP